VDQFLNLKKQEVKEQQKKASSPLKGGASPFVNFKTGGYQSEPAKFHLHSAKL
jgi:hypothetical protein